MSPYRMTYPLHTTTLDGLRIAYRVAGQGPDVLLIHGWVSSSRMWSLMMDALSAHFRCWAIDLPGFADSDKPDASWYSIENYERLINTFADQFGLARFDLIGHSMGGMIALRFAARQPTRVRRLIAINPVVTGRVYWDLRLLVKSPLRHSMLALGRWFWPIASSDLLRRHKSLHARRMSIEWNQATPESAISAARAISHHDLTPLLPHITAPTLVIIGKRDLTAPNAEGRFAAKKIPEARVEELSAGHLPTDDVPQQTHALVSEFLEKEENVLA